MRTRKDETEKTKTRRNWEGANRRGRAMIYMTEQADKTGRERKGEDGTRQVRPRQDGRG